MKKTSFNFDWTVKTGVEDPFGVIFNPVAESTPVVLPHDAMIAEPRDPNTSSGTQYGFYPAKSYTYQKTFFAPEQWAGQTNLLEFEGVMQKATVFLNGEFCVSHANGYTGFYVDLAPFLRYGAENTLKVVAVCQEKGSRWYSGAGIYRDVWLWQGGKAHFLPDRQQIFTESLEDGYAVLCLKGTVGNDSTSHSLRLEASVLEPDGKSASHAESFLPLVAGEQGGWYIRLTVDAPRLWSPEHPELYRFVLKLYDGDTLLDEHSNTFGIRTLRLDARQGLRINGETVKLRGACIHHDNGLIGGVSMPDAERFRVQKLKEAGFNAIRSAHNPASKALLCACDELGMLVMDEFSDMWNEPKNSADHAQQFPQNWQDDLARMVNKDFNHPSVVLYSTGNEVPEIGRVSGAAQNRRIAERFRRLDPTRFTTFGMNGFLAVVDDLALFGGMQAPAEPPAAPAEGSEGLNSAMGGTEQQMLDLFSVSEILTKRLEPAASGVDAAGYNYLTARHVLEHELHPDRVVLGSETYPPEIPRLWRIVEANPHVIGDFTWTGWDYLGEAGIGIFHYEAISGQGVYPDRLAYCGDIDLNGARRPMSYLRQIAYGLASGPVLAVERADRYGQTHDKNNWKYADCLASWTFPGYEEKPVRVRVLADCDEVELLLDGASLGKKRIGEAEPFTAIFELTYRPGTLTAVAHKNGAEVGRDSLTTAGEPVHLRVQADKTVLRAGGQGLAFLTADPVDEHGVWNRWTAKAVTVQVEGAGTLLGFGSAAPSCEGSYQDTTWDTCDGRVMAVVRSAAEPGEIRVTFSAPGCGMQTVTLQSK